MELDICSELKLV